VTRSLADGPVLLDLGGVSFIDSSGIAVLDAVLRLAAAEGRLLTVAATLQPRVRQVLEMTAMLGALTLERQEERA
jgi:anti-anti-sigma factor